ncbi:type VI secretion system protein TssA [Caballeronia ptereochthonis]|uniref:ImpA-like protein n=1 Tax=Caballeronia ptereochthonis TaxID=1777144 RepID=A0A157ZXA0_9BURK|nr:type VI secretion system protein TssA [Caballeronia ptereochthonis]SAK50151.1 ImpA-like protein [Caballeronia ptereochthonis]
MNRADIAAWLTELAPEPCGEDEEYSAEFRALELAIAGKPDAQYGGTVIAATPPDWTLAHSLATTLLARTRDLRVAVHFTRAGMVREGFSGLARGLALIEGLLAQHWSNVHPQLDAGDGDDPTARVNALSALVDGAGLAGELRDVPLVAPRGQRGFTLRDMEVLAGESPLAEGDEMPTLAAIDAAFAQVGAEEGRAQCEALSSARVSLARIETLLTERVGPARALDFGALARPLGRLTEFVAARVEALDPETGRGGSAIETSSSEEGAGSAAATHGAAVAGPATPRHIASARDVSEALDAICAYYAEHEPSSPLPVLLQRARRLVGKSFMEIIEDVAPDGAHQFRHLGGVV